MSYTPYEQVVVTMGHLVQEDVPVVLMPRVDFMEEVEDQIEEALGDNPGVMGAQEALDKIREVAQVVDRFPVGQWIHSTRGCGCIVGEYLVAVDLLGRETPPDTNYDVKLALGEKHSSEVAMLLLNFGLDVDVRLSGRVDQRLREEPNYSTIVIVDDFGWPLPFVENKDASVYDYDV